jgi:hypothetical protein
MPKTPWEEPQHGSGSETGELNEGATQTGTTSASTQNGVELLATRVSSLSPVWKRSSSNLRGSCSPAFVQTEDDKGNKVTNNR